MKRYLLFAGCDYYPEGGMNDFIESFQSVEEAITHHDETLDDDYCRWAHIYDLETTSIVKYYCRGFWGETEEEAHQAYNKSRKKNESNSKHSNYERQGA